MKKLMFAPLLLMFLMGSGCQNQTALDHVAILEQSFTAAETAFIAYLHLPDCDSHPQPCSDDAVVARIQPLDNAAFNAVDQYRNAVLSGQADTVLNELLAAATAAINQLAVASATLH